MRRIGTMMLAVPAAAMGLLILISVFVDVANVVGRYIFLSPIIWAEEILAYLMVWGVFLGAILVTARDDHLNMDVVASVLNAQARRLIDAVILVATICVCGLIGWQSAESTLVILATGERSVAAGVPVWLAYLVLPIGFFGIAAVAAARLWAMASQVRGSRDSHPRSNESDDSGA